MSYFSPIATPAVPQVPSSYVLITTTTTCLSCGHSVSVSEFFALTHLRPRNNLGAIVKHLEPCERPAFNLRVDRTTSAPRTVAYCSVCPPIDLSHLPLPASSSNLYDLAEPTLRNARPTPPKSTAPRPSKPDIKDLA